MGHILGGKGLNLILRFVVGGVFVFAAWDKVVNPQSFAISVRAYQIVPVSVSNVFALCLAWAELVTAVLLIVGLMTRKAAGAAFLLLGMFVVAIAMVLVRGMVVDCGCFGSDGSSTGPLLIVRNLVLMAAAFLVMRHNDGFLGIDGWRRKPQHANASV